MPWTTRPAPAKPARHRWPVAAPAGRTRRRSNATVSLIEHGRTDPSMGLLRRILDALGVSFASFSQRAADAGQSFLPRRRAQRDRQRSDQLSPGRQQPERCRAADSLRTLRARRGHRPIDAEPCAEEGGIVLEGRLEVPLGTRSRCCRRRRLSLQQPPAASFSQRRQRALRCRSACTPPTFDRLRRTPAGSRRRRSSPSPGARRPAR